MKKYYFLLASTVLFFVFVQSCTNTSQTVQDLAEHSDSLVTMAPFEAIEMPATLANGDPFPTDSNTVNGWLSEKTVVDGVETNPNVISHSWALWKALTDYTDQEFNGRKLRLYETWYTPQDVMRAKAENTPLENLSRTDGQLQFRKKFKFGHDENLNTAAGDISGKVKYNPAMAQQALDGDYFNTAVLEAKIVEGEINTVSFHPSSVSLKPIYRVLTSVNKVAGKEDTYYFNIWGGPEDGGKPIQDFSGKIYVTTNNDDPAIDNETTWGIESFIHHTMSEAEAYTYNNSSKEGQEFTTDTAHAGDPVILLGCHVTTRETQRWLWQSFFWTINPDDPPFPSSATVADGRKAFNFTSPADHYSVSLAYSMMSPALPLSGPPVNIKEADVAPVYGLNPYIEGTFTSGVFPKQNDFFSGDYAQQFYEGNVDGLTSNCMSCHSQAFYTKGLSLNDAVKNFLADQYVNRNAPWFESSIQLDFAWSLFPGFEPPPSQVTPPSQAKNE